MSSIYWITSLKPICKSITSVVKGMFQIFEECSNKYRYFSGVSTFWAVLNNEAMISMIEDLNKRNKGESMMTFDFPILCTKISHRKFLKVLYQLIDFI